MNLYTSRTVRPMLQAAYRIAICSVAVFVLTFDIAAQRSPDQLRPVSASDPRLGRLFFENIKGLLREWYYDPNFNGAEIGKSFLVADDKLRSLTGIGQMFATVSDALMELDDPQTYLLPPARELEPEYGFTTMMVGDSCLVTSVKPGSKAEAGGLRIGDRIDLFGSVPPTRRSY